MTFPAFNFAPHAGALADPDFTAIMNGGHTSVGAVLDAPELLPLLQTWSRYSDNKRYGLRSVAEEAPAFYRSPGATAHFAARIAEGEYNRAWNIGKSLLGSDDHSALVEASMINERHLLRNVPQLYLAVIVAQRFPEEFAKLALEWLEQSKLEIRKWRRDSRNMNGPAEGWLQSLYAAITLAPSLDPAIAKALERRKEPGAIVALLRHGHAKTLERMQSAEAFIELHNCSDYSSAASVLVALGEQGRTMLRDVLRDPKSPVDRRDLVRAAVELGLWDRELTDAYFAAAEAGVAGSLYAANDLPLLERDDVRRLEKVPGMFESALARQRDTTKKPAKPYNDGLWQKSTDELVDKLATLTPKQMTRFTDLVEGARRAGDRFTAAAAELGSSKNPMTQLVIRLAARPPQQYPGCITGTDVRAGLALQTLERRWRPERFAPGSVAAPKPARKPKRASKSVATDAPRL